MAFDFVSALTPYDSSSSSSGTVSGWTSVDDDDIGFALVVRTESSSAPSSTPTGWTSLGSISRASPEPNYAELFYRVKQSGDGNPTWNFSAADRLRIEICVYDSSGFDVSDPINDSSNTEYTVNNTIRRASSVNAVDGGGILWVSTTADTFGAVYTPPTGYTEDIDRGSASSRAFSCFAHTTSSSDGATGDLDGSSIGSDDKHSYAVALNPVSATTLDGGTFSYSGGTITETQSIQQSLIGGTFSYSGGDLPDSTIGDLIQEDLDGGTFSYSGGDIGSNVEIIETLQFGVFSYSGGSLIEETLVAPLLDSISDETITNGQTGITITGSNFSSATLELCNSSNYNGATVKVSQSITAQTSTTVTFTCDHDDQLFGYKYLFVTNSNGARNLIGFKVNVGRTVYAFVTNDAGSRSDGHEITMFEGETNFLEDGDMEYADVSAWGSISGGVQSKSSSVRPGTDGILSLRVDVALSDSYAGASQNPLTNGVQYKITGWAMVTNGLSAAIGNVSGTDIATFNASTWTSFDYTFTAAGSNIYLGYAGGINPGDYVLFDDVKIVRT